MSKRKFFRKTAKKILSKQLDKIFTQEILDDLFKEYYEKKIQITITSEERTVVQQTNLKECEDICNCVLDKPKQNPYHYHLRIF